MNKNIESSLSLLKLVFDEINFKRLGFKNDNQSEFSFEVRISTGEINVITIILQVNKKDEYELSISLTGYFLFDSEEELDKETKEHLIKLNTVAIMMPYLRAQLSLITSQPDTDSIIVLPIFNIESILDEKNRSDS